MPRKKEEEAAARPNGCRCYNSEKRQRGAVGEGCRKTSCGVEVNELSTNKLLPPERGQGTVMVCIRGENSEEEERHYLVQSLRNHLRSGDSTKLLFITAQPCKFELAGRKSAVHRVAFSSPPPSLF